MFLFLLEKMNEQFQVCHVPVSLTSVPCKIPKYIVMSRLKDHPEKNYILSLQQHGFRKIRSCETQLVEFTELPESIESGKQTDLYSSWMYPSAYSHCSYSLSLSLSFLSFFANWPILLTLKKKKKSSILFVKRLTFWYGSCLAAARR